MPRPRRAELPAVAPAPSLLREMPEEERPRQRLLRGGGEALADPEVLSLILGSGFRGACALELAREILTETGGLTGLVGMRPDTLQRRGLGKRRPPPSSPPWSWPGASPVPRFPAAYR